MIGRGLQRFDGDLQGAVLRPARRAPRLQPPDLRHIGDKAVENPNRRFTIAEPVPGAVNNLRSPRTIQEHMKRRGAPPSSGTRAGSTSLADPPEVRSDGDGDSRGLAGVVPAAAAAQAIYPV
jgi:hypothetical protein